VLLFALLKVGKFVLLKISGKNVVSRKWMNHYPSLELFVWFTYLFVSLPYFYQYNLFFAIFLTFLLIVISLWLAWYSMSDIVAGFVVRNNPAITKNRRILIDNQIVTVNRLLPGYLQGTLDDGKVICLRYRKLLNLNVIYIDDDVKYTSKTIHIKIARATYSNDINQLIRSFLLAQPYSAVKYPPVMKTTAEDPQYITYSITFYVLNAEKIHEVENALRMEFESATN
jgi:hypothetical protein